MVFSRKRYMRRLTGSHVRDLPLCGTLVLVMRLPELKWTRTAPKVVDEWRRVPAAVKPSAELGRTAKRESARTGRKRSMLRMAFNSE